MTNIYRIGVSIAMTSNGAQVLGVLSRHLLGVNAQTNQLTGGFNRLKLAIGGALAVGAGMAILGAFKTPLEEARKLEVAVTKFGNFGLGPQRTREAAEFAKAMNIAGSTYVDNMKRMSEAQGVFRESGLPGEQALRGAKLAAPVLAKIDFANSALDDESKAKMHAQGLAMLRFIEMRGGVNSPEKFNAIADAGFKAIQSSGGNVNWEQMRQFAARAGVAGQGLTDEALFGKLEPVIGELKGSTAGFALRTAFNRLNGIVRIPNQVAHDLVKNGIWDGSKVQWNSQGGIKRFVGEGGPLKDQELFARDPVAFYEKYILPTYAGMSQTERARRNAMTFGSTGGAMFSLIDRQLPAIHHSVEAQRKALGIDQAYKAAGGTLNGKIIDMQARYVNLMERLGEAVLPLAVRGLEVLVPALTKLTDWVGKHPGQVALFAKMAVVVGAGLVALGTAAVGVAIFSGGWVGAAVAGIGVLVGGFTAWAVFNWKGLVSFAEGAWSFIKRLVEIGAYVAAHPLTWFLPTGMRPATQADVDASRRHTALGGAPLHLGQGMFDLNPRALTRSGPFGAAMDAFGSGSAVPPARVQKQSYSGDVHIDGQKVGKVLWRHQADDLDRSSRSGGGAYDPGMVLSPVGARYA